jgi:AP endonuclease-1
MRDPRLATIPLILETPATEKPLEVGELAVWTKEIKLLYEIQAIGDEEWPVKLPEIEARWRGERDTLNPPKPSKFKATKKVKRGKKGDEEGCESHSEE